MSTLTILDKKKNVAQWTIIASVVLLPASVGSFGFHAGGCFAFLFYPYCCLLFAQLLHLGYSHAPTVIWVSMLIQMPVYGLLIGRWWIRDKALARCAVLLSLHLAATVFCFAGGPWPWSS